jgi:hypothetical protein
MRPSRPVRERELVDLSSRRDPADLTGADLDEPQRAGGDADRGGGVGR